MGKYHKSYQHHHCQLGSNKLPGWQIAFSSGTITTCLCSVAGGNTYSVVTGSTYNDGTWKHVVVTYTGNGSRTGLSIYVNGISDTVASGNNTNPGTLVNSDLRIGSRGGGAPPQFQGLMDDVRLYSRALSATEVSQLYTNTPAVSNSGLVGEWKL